jgi:hypothetical protein
VLVSLDFVYTPTDDVDGAIAQHIAAFGGVLEWKVRAMGTAVACVRVAEHGPKILLSEHLEGTQPILVYRVDDYDEAVERLRTAGVADLQELEIPHGPCASFRTAGGQRAAVYELVRPGAMTHFDGRFDD